MESKSDLGVPCWTKPDGTPVSCTEKVKVLNENYEELRSMALNAAEKVEKQMDKFAFNMALEEIWTVVRRANKYIDEKTPWILAKDESRKAELDTVMKNLAEAIRIVSVLIEPFMHSTTRN